MGTTRRRASFRAFCASFPRAAAPRPRPARAASRAQMNRPGLLLAKGLQCNLGRSALKGVQVAWALATRWAAGWSLGFLAGQKNAPFSAHLFDRPAPPLPLAAALGCPRPERLSSLL